MTDFGRDLWCDGDIRPDCAETTGTVLVAQALKLRYETERGGLFYDRDYGEGLTELVNQAGITPWLVERKLESGALKDERISECKASAVLIPEEEKIVATIRCESALGPFTSVVTITALEVSMLLV